MLAATNVNIAKYRITMVPWFVKNTKLIRSLKNDLLTSDQLVW